MEATRSLNSAMVDEHGPGPPREPAAAAAAAAAACPPVTVGRHLPAGSLDMDDRLGKELVQKEEELERLRYEVQGYVTKYQTLVHSLQESKQQCNVYKRKNDELAHKLDRLAGGLSPTAENGGRRADVTVTKGQLLDSTTELDDLGLEGESNDVRGSGGRSAVSSESSTARSSPSFVRINSGGSLDDDPPPQPTSSSGLVDRGREQQQQQQHLQRDFVELVGPVDGRGRGRSASDDDGAAAAAESETRCISLEVDQLAEQLRSGFGSRDPAAVRDVSSDLIRTGIAVRQLEKLSQAQKVKIATMSESMDALKLLCETKQQTIDDLQKRYDELQEVVHSLQTAQDKAMKEAHTKYIENEPETSEGQSVGTFSAEWVAVEKRTSLAPTATQGNDDAVEVTTMSAVEMELRKRIEKLNTSICELVTVNRSWDEHCRKLELDHSQQLAALNSELCNARQQLEQIRCTDDQRQAEFDQMLLNAKKQREVEEMAKEEALSQLHFERRSRADLEEKCTSLNGRISELEMRLRDLQLTRQMGATSSLSTPGRTMLPQFATLDRDLELQILREQVTVFKEDFDNERADREAARAANEQLRQQLNEITSQLETTQQKLYRTIEELKQLQIENADWKKRFQKVADDVKVMQQLRQVRPESVATTAAAAMQYVSPLAAGGYVTAPTPLHTRPSQPPQHQFYRPPPPPANYQQPTRVTFSTERWPCPRCTFLNREHQPTCEMCGYVGLDLQLQPRGVGAPSAAASSSYYSDAVDRVAGLPVVTLSSSSSSSSSSRLSPAAQARWYARHNSSLETDESRRPSSL